MKSSKRRQLLRGASMLAAGGVAAYAMPGSATAQTRSPFSVSPTFIPIAGGSDLFPVRRIYCIGRNYAAHAREMGSDPTREPPFFFQKPTDAVQNVPIGATVDHPYPPLTKNYHYEIELVAALNKGGRNIPIDRALEHVFGYTVGLDMTRRDLQRAMGDEKKPWEIGKELRSFGAARSAPARRRGRALHQRRDLAQGQRPDQAKRGLESDDLVSGGTDQQAVRSVRACARRHHLFGHAGKCGPGRQGRHHGRAHIDESCPTSASGSSS